jgi:hypothetical protein
MIRCEAYAELLDIVHAGGPAARFPCRLHGRYQHANKNADNGDDDEQFNERKSLAIHARISFFALGSINRLAEVV